MGWGGGALVQGLACEPFWATVTFKLVYTTLHVLSIRPPVYVVTHVSSQLQAKQGTLAFLLALPPVRVLGCWALR